MLYEQLNSFNFPLFPFLNVIHVFSAHFLLCHRMLDPTVSYCVSPKKDAKCSQIGMMKIMDEFINSAIVNRIAVHKNGK